LQCVAVCCSVLPCVAVCCSVLQSIYVYIYVCMYIYMYTYINMSCSQRLQALHVPYRAHCMDMTWHCMGAKSFLDLGPSAPSLQGLRHWNPPRLRTWLSVLWQDFPRNPVPKSILTDEQKQQQLFLKKTENSNLHGFEVHRPSSKGTKLRLQVIKAIIHQPSRCPV